MESITPVTLTPTQRVGTALPVPATEIGVVGGRTCFGVSPAGSIVTPAGVVVDWWIGAEDRWHLVPDEAAVRQGLGDDGVVIETRCKVPGGDIVHRVAAVPSGGSVLARVEIENATPVPVAIAAVVRVPAAGPIVIGTDTVGVDGALVVRSSRSIARVLVAADLTDAFRRTAAGDAVPVAALGEDTAGTVAVAIFPVPHTATLRLAVASGPDDTVAMPDDLPPFDAVARGWERHLDVGARVALPDDRLVRALTAARRQLLAAAGGAIDEGWDPDEPWAAPVAAVALDAWGHDGEALDLLLSASGTDDLAVHATRPIAEAGALVWAWAERLERRPDPELSAAVAPLIEELALRLLARPRRRLFGRNDSSGSDAGAAGWRAVGLAAAASLLSRVGEGLTGADIVDALPRLVADLDPAAATLPLALGGRRLGSIVDHVPSIASVALERSGAEVAASGDGAARVDDLVTLAALVSPTGAPVDRAGYHDRAASALVALAVARAMVDEPDGAGGPVALLAGLPGAWAGATIEWHELAATGASVSCAVRWHGPRPALLWEVRGTGRPVVLTAPTLDPDWRHETDTADRAPDGSWKGEALLAPTPGLESTAMESPEVRRGERIDPDDQPGSFA
ncbi:MAG: hypothetical protein ACE367_25720 [Acidimicrobiales bacterium]